jgi:RimJ/RimL family protein N-acetyltransferase
VRLVEVRDDDFAALLRGEQTLRDGLRVPPGGVDVPGVLAHVRAIAAKLHRAGYRNGHWMVVAGGEIVGLIGFKDPPSALGEVEIGYGIAASRRRRGFATRAVAAVLSEAGGDSAIRTVLAETAAGNTASQRALIRSGFALAGTRQDPTDGELLLWRRSIADPDGY